MHRKSRVAAAAVLLLAGFVVGSCSSGDDDGDGADRGDEPVRPRIEISADETMVDEPVDITVSGVDPHAVVEVVLTLNRTGGTWRSTATFEADDDGRVPLAETAPTKGDYEGVDPMGLFWSAQLQSEGVTPSYDANEEQAVLTATVGGTEIASASLRRFHLQSGAEVVDVREQGLVATVFVPEEAGPHPAMVVLGGSEGGLASSSLTARHLASHSYTAMALSYFDRTPTEGLPTALASIPLEYVETALTWLANQPSVDPERIGILGRSRGAELALQVAADRPEVRAVVAYAPSSVAWPAVPPGTGPAWTRGGQAVPSMPPLPTGPIENSLDVFGGALDDAGAVTHAEIPVERIGGGVLLISGDDDQLWPSGRMADAVVARLDRNNFEHPVDHLVYAGAGHVIPSPY